MAAVTFIRENVEVFPKRGFLSIQAGFFCHADVCFFPHLDYKYFLIVKIGSWFPYGQPPPPKTLYPSWLLHRLGITSARRLHRHRGDFALFLFPSKEDRDTSATSVLIPLQSFKVNGAISSAQRQAGLTKNASSVWQPYTLSTPVGGSNPSPWHFNPEPKPPVHTDAFLPSDKRVCGAIRRQKHLFQGQLWVCAANGGARDWRLKLFSFVYLPVNDYGWLCNTSRVKILNLCFYWFILVIRASRVWLWNTIYSNV